MHDYISTILKSMPQIKPDELQALIDDKADFHLIDIRDNEEWRISRLENAKHIPRGGAEWDIEKLTSENKDQNLVIYCNSGARSALVVKSLQDMGYTNTKYLYGGLYEWIACGGSVDNQAVEPEPESAELISLLKKVSSEGMTKEETDNYRAHLDGLYK